VATAGDTGLEHMVRLGVFLRNMDDFPVFNAIAGNHLQPPYPVRTTVPASLVGFDIELDAVFWIPPSAKH